MPLDYDSLAGGYAVHRRAMPQVVEALIAAGGITRASRVLDVGCGTGNYALALADLAGCRCWGVEPSAGMRAEARKRSGRIRLRAGRAERLDFPEGFFDLVFSVDVIHYVEDRGTFFREARRVLRPGGVLCTVTDSEDIIRRRQPLSAYFPETVAVELGRYPRISDLRAEKAEAGFGGLREIEAEDEFGITDIRMYREKAFSSLHLIPEEAFERGLQRMEHDLQRGPIRAVVRYLLLWGTKEREAAADRGRKSAAA